MREPIVSIVKCASTDWETSVLPAVRDAVDLIGGIETIVSPGDTVFVKPNYISPKSFETGATTNPAVIRAVIRLLKEGGAKRILIGEGSAVGFDTTEAFANNHLYELEDSKVSLFDIKKDDFVWIPNPGAFLFKRIRVPKKVLESNVIVNIPVMKTHDALPITLGLKNMKGIIHESDKKRFHKWGLEHGIVDVNRFALPELTVLDATIGMEGLGPNSGDPANMGLILASTDTVALDTVGTHVMGVDPAEVRYIGMAAEAGLGCDDMERIDVVGRQIAEVAKKFKRVQLRTGDYDQYGIRIIEEGACSGCSHFIESTVVKLIERGGIENLGGYTIVYGQNALPPEDGTDPDNLLLIGTCLRKYRDKGKYLPGCPPHQLHLFELLGM
jgi:uncharacterized protein (DUF362 family)